VDATNADGWSPLHCAAQSESTESVALLIRRGADVHALTRIGDRSALHIAAFNGCVGATKLLVLKGAAIDAVDGDGLSPCASAVHRSTTCPCSSDEPGREWGQVIAFLEKVAHMPTEQRHAFVRRSWQLHVSFKLQAVVEREDVPALQRLLTCFGDFVDSADHDGSTALMAAALCGEPKTLSLLLEHGASVELRTNLGETALHFAAREGHETATKLLVQWGADGSAKTRFGASPLDLAKRHQYAEWAAVVTLLEQASRYQPAVGLKHVA